jgi:hypothetical protein
VTYITAVDQDPVHIAGMGLRRSLLTCGILASLYYAGMNVIVPMFDPSYSSATQTISELSAVGAPTRTLWVWLAQFYGLLLAAFGIGVWMAAGTSSLLRFVSVLFIAQVVIGMFWPPMHQREVLAAGGGSMTDTLHIAFTAAWGLTSITAIVLAAAAFGKRFRIYSAITLAVLIVFGVLTGLESPDMEANLPTPWIGVFERINIAAFMIWLIVFAVALIQRERPHQ